MDNRATETRQLDEFTGHRLAELVMHLTGCQAELALDAVLRSMRTPPATVDEALDVVARSMVALRRRRMAIDLRDRANSLTARALS